MFIKKLYHYNKALFLGFIIFILTFLYINYKWGMVATPVLEYGMFAGKFHYADTQTVYIVEADGRGINNASVSFTDRDILQIYADRFIHQKEINQNAYSTMKKYLGFVGLSAMATEEKFVPHVSDTLFTQWYQSKVNDIAGIAGGAMVVYQQHFIWQNNELKPIDKPTKLPFIVVH
ncbi:MAG: hypothetical protein JST86_17550 [Bacteroidetes bacterium]|nr:hypothetical protein [Bacteroidota bacterium]